MSDLDTVHTLINQLSKLNVKNSNEIALIGLMTGVLFSLEQAIIFKFHNSRMNLQFDDERSEIIQTLIQLNLGSKPDEPWLSGYYFDSAIMRLAALNERVDKFAGIKKDVASDVRRIVNKIKHEIDAGISSGWRIQFSDALKASEDLCKILEKCIR